MGQAVRICILMSLLILFNVYPDKVGVYRSALEPASFAPLLGRGFYETLSWLNTWWLLALGLASVLLFFEHWTGWLRAADLALDLFGVAVLWRLLAGAPLVLNVGWDWSPGGQVAPFGGWPLWSLTTLVRVALGIWLVLHVLSMLGKLARLLPGRWPSQSTAPRS
jgi:hypothetical protein